MQTDITPLAVVHMLISLPQRKREEEQRVEEERRRVEKERMREELEEQRRQEQEDYFLALKMHEEEKFNATGKTQPPIPAVPSPPPQPPLPSPPPRMIDTSSSLPLVNYATVPAVPPPSYESTSVHFHT